MRDIWTVVGWLVRGQARDTESGDLMKLMMRGKAGSKKCKCRGSRVMCR